MLQSSATTGSQTDHSLSLFDEVPQSDYDFLEFMMTTNGHDSQTESVTRPMEEDVDNDLFEVPTPTSKKVVKGGNYSTAEDKALVVAWQEVSMDPVTGKDQPGSSYWQRISDHFHKNVSPPSCRSIGSLNHRWTSIAECCSRWAGCVSSVERQYSSGTTMQDRLNSTQELYQLREPKNRPFVMLHCWSLLQHNEKWINRNADTHPTKKHATPDLNNEAYDDMSGQSTTQSSNWETNERPPGRKKEKERRKNGEDTSEFETAIQDMVKAKKEIEAEKKVDQQERWEKLMSLQERQIEIPRDKVTAKKMKQECRIIFQDLNGLDETQKAYVLATRAEILASKVAGSQSGSNV